MLEIRVNVLCLKDFNNMQSVKYDFGDTGLFRYGSYSNLPQINQYVFTMALPIFIKHVETEIKDQNIVKWTICLSSPLSWIRIQ